MRKIISLVMAVTMLIASSLCVSVNAAQSGVCGDNLTYTLDDNGLLTITGTGAMYDEVWCFNYDGIKKVVVEEGVTTIGVAEFMLNETINEVILPKGLTQIGDSAFHTTNIKSIVIPKSVTNIGRLAFFQCSQLSDIYYAGTETDWDKIEIGANNDMWLTKDIIHFNYSGGSENNDMSESKNTISVLLDGVKIEFDVLPQIINDRTMVPMRAIFEKLGVSVEWNGETRTITSKKDDTTIIMTIDDTNMYVNDEIKVLDSPACLVDGRTLVPVRAISEALNLSVNWNEDTNTVDISSVPVV